MLAVVFIAAVMGYRFLGGYDWVGAIWMVVITISTVGHSERSDFGAPMQLFTVLVILFGMTASVYTFSGFFQLVLEGELERVLGSRRMTREVQQLSGHVIVCGLGRMGEHLVRDLNLESQPFVAIDNDPAKIEEAAEDGVLCVLGDATDEDCLLNARVQQAKTLVTTLPSDADSVFITLTAREQNPNLQIIARAEQRSTEKKLIQAGANRVVMPSLVGATRMVRMITRPSISRLLDEVIESSFEEIELDEVRVGEQSPIAGQTIEQVQSPADHDLMIVAIQRHESDLIVNPKREVEVLPRDTLIVMGHPRQIKELRAACEIRG